MHSLNIFGSNHESELQKSRKRFSTMTTKNMYGHNKRGNYVAWNCTGEKLGSGSQDETIRIWTGVERKSASHNDTLVLKGHTQPVNSICWHPTNPDLLVSTSDDKCIKFWDAKSGLCTSTVEAKYEAANIVWGSDGNSAICGGKLSNNMDALLLIDVRMAKVKKIVKFHYPINELSRNLEGNRLYLVASTGDIEVWNWTKDGFSDFKNLKVLNAHSGNGANCMDYAASGKHFAVGTTDSLVSIWDAHELVSVRTLGHLTGSVRCVSFSHDGAYVASACEDGLVDIAHVESGESVHSLTNGFPVTSLAWHPSKLLLAYTGKDKDRHDRENGVIKAFGTFV